jgi:hypothetical protein
VAGRIIGAHDRQAIGAGRNILRGERGEPRLEAVKLIGARNAVNKGILKRPAHGLGLHAGLFGSLIGNLARPSLGDVAIHVNIATENRKRFGLARERAGRLGVAVIDSTKANTRESILLGIGVGVAGHFLKRKHLQKRRILDDRFDHAPLQVILQELCGLGQ